MSLLNLFVGNKLSNPKFIPESNNFEVINPTNQCVFYFEGCNPLVKKGDEVEVGQVLSQPSGEFAVPVICTVKGKVSEVSDRFNSDGKKVKAVVVSEIEESLVQEKKIDFSNLTKEEILVKIKELAIIDENGVSFADILANFKGSKVVVNESSLEPNFKQYEALKSMSEEINVGKAVVKSVLGLDIITDKNTDDALIIDLHTLVYLGEAFITGCPHMYEYISVFGSAAKTNKLLKVKIGTVVSEIFDKLNGNNEELFKVVAGGALNGNVLFNLDVAISKTIRGILFLNKKEGSKEKECSCIRCAKCLRVCPEGLNPIKIVELWERNDKDEFVKFGGNKCVSCGLCSYVCPSNIELAHIIKTAKEYTK